MSWIKDKQARIAFVHLMHEPGMGQDAFGPARMPWPLPGSDSNYSPATLISQRLSLINVISAFRSAE